MNVRLRSRQGAAASKATRSKDVLSKGFTLVEVMLVAMIMGLMFMSVTKLMQAARKTRDTIHNFQETQLVGPAILEMITADLAGIFTTNRPRTIWLKIEDHIENGQDADRIHFVTTSDSLLPKPGTNPEEDGPMRSDLNEVGYALRPNESNDEFLEIWRREDFGVDDEPFRSGQYTFLSDQVKAFNIEVFQNDGPDEDPIDAWGPDSGNEEWVGLPAFIRMTLTIELKPRINRESMDVTGRNRRTIDYERIVRFPERLRAEEGAIPVLTVPPAPGAVQAPGDPNAPGGGTNSDIPTTVIGGGQGGGRGGDGGRAGGGGRGSADTGNR